MDSHSFFSGYSNAIDRVPEAVYVLHERQEQRFPFHKHRKGQLTYIEGGLAYLNTTDKAYFLPARHYIWIPPQMDHYVQHSNPALIVRNIYFPDEADLTHPFFSHLGIYPVSNLLLEMIVFTQEWKGDVLPDGTHFQFLQTLKHILPEVSRHPLPIVLPVTDNERLLPLIHYLHQHLSDPLQLPDVAQQFGFSVRSLSRLFQKTMNISFIQYLKLCRIIRGMEELLQTDKSVSEIAYDVGYTSLSTFSNTFYQLVNQRPGEFRAMK